MEIFEYAMGFGGWVAVISLLFLYNFGTIHPITVVLTPIATICLTYIAIYLCQIIFQVVLKVLELMFRAEIILTSFMIFTMGVLLFTIRETVVLTHIEDVD